MHGGLSVESDGLRRIARLVEAAGSELRSGAGPLNGSEDAGRSTNELSGALGELHDRLLTLVDDLDSFAERLISVAKDFDSTDDKVATSLLRLPGQSLVP